MSSEDIVEDIEDVEELDVEKVEEEDIEAEGTEEVFYDPEMEELFHEIEEEEQVPTFQKDIPKIDFATYELEKAYNKLLTRDIKETSQIINDLSNRKPINKEKLEKFKTRLQTLQLEQQTYNKDKSLFAKKLKLLKDIEAIDTRIKKGEDLVDKQKKLIEEYKNILPTLERLSIRQREIYNISKEQYITRKKGKRVITEKVKEFRTQLSEEALKYLKKVTEAEGGKKLKEKKKPTKHDILDIEVIDYDEEIIVDTIKLSELHKEDITGRIISVVPSGDVGYVVVKRAISLPKGVKKEDRKDVYNKLTEKKKKVAIALRQNKIKEMLAVEDLDEHTREELQIELSNYEAMDINYEDAINDLNKYLNKFKQKESYIIPKVFLTDPIIVETTGRMFSEEGKFLGQQEVEFRSKNKLIKLTKSIVERLAPKILRRQKFEHTYFKGLKGEIPKLDIIGILHDSIKNHPYIKSVIRTKIEGMYGIYPIFDVKEVKEMEEKGKAKGIRYRTYDYLDTLPKFEYCEHMSAQGFVDAIYNYLIAKYAPIGGTSLFEKMTVIGNLGEVESYILSMEDAINTESITSNLSEEDAIKWVLLKKYKSPTDHAKELVDMGDREVKLLDQDVINQRDNFLKVIYKPSEEDLLTYIKKIKKIDDINALISQLKKNMIEYSSTIQGVKFSVKNIDRYLYDSLQRYKTVSRPDEDIIKRIFEYGITGEEIKQKPSQQKRPSRRGPQQKPLSEMSELEKAAFLKKEHTALEIEERLKEERLLKAFGLPTNIPHRPLPKPVSQSELEMLQLSQTEKYNISKDELKRHIKSNVIDYINNHFSNYERYVHLINVPLNECNKELISDEDYFIAYVCAVKGGKNKEKLVFSYIFSDREKLSRAIFKDKFITTKIEDDSQLLEAAKAYCDRILKDISVKNASLFVQEVKETTTEKENKKIVESIMKALNSYSNVLHYLCRASKTIMFLDKDSPIGTHCDHLRVGLLNNQCTGKQIVKSSIYDLLPPLSNNESYGEGIIKTVEQYIMTIINEYITLIDPTIHTINKTYITYPDLDIDTTSLKCDLSKFKHKSK